MTNCIKDDLSVGHRMFICLSNESRLEKSIITLHITTSPRIFRLLFVVYRLTLGRKCVKNGKIQKLTKNPIFKRFFCVVFLKNCSQCLNFIYHLFKRGISLQKPNFSLNQGQGSIIKVRESAQAIKIHKKGQM